MDWGRFKPYVSVAQRRAKAKRKLTQLAKTGHVAAPVEIAGRTIASTFWGKAWCDHLESFSDFANRLPRGRTYVRNGSVVDLQIEPGQIVALVSGSELYKVRVRIAALAARAWEDVRVRCAGRIGSLVELLQGRLSCDVMQVVTNRDGGLFPIPKEISLQCSCPDSAGMCKHLAATLYGVGARLDCQPELLFVLRQVDHREMIAKVADAARVAKPAAGGKRATIAAERLADVFGIELEDSGAAAEPETKTGRKKPVTTPQKASRKSPRQATSTAAAKPAVVEQLDDVARKRKTAKSQGPKKAIRQPAAVKTRAGVAAKKQQKNGPAVTSSAAARRKTM